MAMIILFYGLMFRKIFCVKGQIWEKWMLGMIGQQETLFLLLFRITANMFDFLKCCWWRFFIRQLENEQIEIRERKKCEERVSQYGTFRRILLRKGRLIAICTVLGGHSFCGRNQLHCFFRRCIMTSASLYVVQQFRKASREDNPDITSSELTASQQLADTCGVIIQSNSVLDKVINELGLSISEEQLRDKIEVNYSKCNRSDFCFCVRYKSETGQGYR